MLSELDKKIVREVQGDLPLDPRPYKVIAQRLGIEEDFLIDKINEFLEKGYIRRMGAALRHRKIGLKANPMIVWQVPKDKIDEVGTKLSSLSQVTHCYHRKELPKLNYNVYSMIHAETREDCYELAKEMSKMIGIEKYNLLFSEKELKKTSMKYFMED
ncbi:DNA-binding transcriptional regulator, Lrp family [Desulfonispora thiosulfatigenes DSM 11270]|uniref:siroheme decarboxylase n=1 Tax=Desulfonispora thiosulfatigenes DSM 11270 TaxID=656914 RepID=A0A1W1VFZ1_DESTI|nr:Lrp/AsnC family transcriptional regulator [Desulfonispora thiosulfatigenes]SMB92255.1 DNA-binding transcriptional regulator, Lrp family [Desulfonispora thiosulfatigenes DSM 11270]